MAAGGKGAAAGDAGDRMDLTAPIVTIFGIGISWRDVMPSSPASRVTIARPCAAGGLVTTTLYLIGIGLTERSEPT